MQSGWEKGLIMAVASSIFVLPLVWDGQAFSLGQAWAWTIIWLIFCAVMGWAAEKPNGTPGEIADPPERRHDASPTQGLTISMYPEREMPRGAASQRAARLGAFVENVDTGTVLNRDGWSCGICGMEIDPKLRHPNRRAGTIDHIIPLSQGGQHHYGNVQAAHYSCNSAKGNRTRPEDLAKYKRMNGDAV
ncbi:HNH endonuclease [Corynebacterium sp. AOP36-E1-14]|uniref:HNH endonuclease n=2 Tax=Corynebacterium TaxID=1716 RepID=UPI004034A841